MLQITEVTEVMVTCQEEPSQYRKMCDMRVIPDVNAAVGVAAMTLGDELWSM